MQLTLHEIAYGCVYLLGFLLYATLPSRVFSRPECITLAIFAADGAILGGRLGYCLCYEPLYYTQHLLEAIQIWRGGMSYHGGAIGLILGLYLGTLILKSSRLFIFLAYDRASLCALVVIPCGRLCNFYNGELWGRVTDKPWGVIFEGADLNPRHPVQLYEALTEGPLLAVFLYLVIRRFKFPAGGIACLYLLGYSLFRFATEFVREPDRMVGFIGGLTMGQWLSLFTAVLGAGLFYRLCWKKMLIHQHGP